MSTVSCKHCGGEIPPRSKPTCGTRPGFCSVECKKVYVKAYLSKWCAENKAWTREYRNRIRDQVRAWDRDFYARNRERRKKRRTDHYLANTEKELAAARRYAKENPDRIRALGRKSQLKRRAVIAKVFVETVDPAVVFERDRGVCGICMTLVERTSTWEVDHIVPLSKGGAHAYANVQLSHRKCNRSKGSSSALSE